MPKLPVLSGKDILKILNNIGLIELRQNEVMLFLNKTFII